LGKDQIGVYDDFFELGGHSLKAMKLVNKIFDRLKVLVKLNEIFINSRLVELSSIIRANQWIEDSKNSVRKDRNIIEL
jgi:hypothetical protein